MMNKDKFQALVRRILQEEINKRNPTMNADGVDPEKKNRTFPSDDNSRDAATKEDLLNQLKKAVEAVDPSYTVQWDDHDDLTISGRDMVFLSINPQWEDNYRIIFFVRNEDRLVFHNLTWEQVLEFVKNNLNQPHIHTGVEKARDKSWRNALDQTKAPDKGMPEKDKPTIKPLTNEPPSGTKNKEKDYTVNDVEDPTDVQDQPMKDAEEFKSQRDHKVQDPVKLRRRKPDTKLTIKQS